MRSPHTRQTASARPLWMRTGGWGFALSPVLSQLMAELISGEAVSLPVEAFGLAECQKRA